MTVAFIVAAILAGIFFILWETAREKSIEDKGKIQNLQNRLEEVRNSPERYDSSTPLSLDYVKDTIRFHGFVPFDVEEGWVGFKCNGETRLINYDGRVIQFFISYDISGSEIEHLRKAAIIASEEFVFGCAEISEDDDSIIFRVYGIEKSYEHFRLAFMDYLHLINALVDTHRRHYSQLQQEASEKRVPALPQPDSRTNNLPS